MDDLHGSIRLPTIWIALEGRKFTATSSHTHRSVAPIAYFVLEDYADTAAEAVASFIRSLVHRPSAATATHCMQEPTPLPKPEPIPQHILDQMQQGDDHGHHHHHHGHGHHHHHGHDHGMGHNFGL